MDESDPFPANGIQVIDGSSGKDVFCAKDPKLTHAPTGKVIAAQCCVKLDQRPVGASSKDVCRRYQHHSRTDCIGGNAKTGSGFSLRTMDFRQNYEECEARGLQMCEQSCSGRGCYYNNHPVWTNIECAPPTPVDSKKALAVNHCNGAVEEQCVSVEEKHAVRCCDVEFEPSDPFSARCGPANSADGSISGGSVCSSAVHGRFNTPLLSATGDGTNANHDAAIAECAEQGKRVCSAEELRGTACCGTGCGHDARLVWSDTKC